MIRWREGIVESERSRWPGAIEYDVRLAGQESVTVRGLAYPEVVGEPVVGDRVLLNVSALERGLGTGGLALIVAVPDRLPADPPAGPGHVVKARYTPAQAMVLGVDEQESPHHELLRDADSIDGMPVIVADLHSAVPAIIAGLRSPAAGGSETPTPAGLSTPTPAGRVARSASGGRIETTPPRVVYVMSDGGALPMAFSRTIAGLRDADWIVGSVTVGQAYGGDLEAVNVHTGLLAARLVLNADVVVLSQGPGNLGTGTRWGFSGVAAGDAINATAALGGRAVASLRVSQADPRERHRGISHHSWTAYGRVALAPADLPVPQLSGDLGQLIGQQAADLVEASDGRLTRHDIDVSGLRDALIASPVPLRTMGRDLDADEASFLAAAAAGRYTANLLG